MMFAKLAMRALRLLDPERAHRAALLGLRLGAAGPAVRADDPALAVQALGLDFPNPIGLAAGFDKDAVAVTPLHRLGFGFVEAGTVTPRPQAGNPRPRMFRLAADGAAINRLGFNNAGLAAYVAQVRRLGGRDRPLGANVGINKDGAEPERDYPALIAAVSPYVDYVTINVSSPNTPGLRDLQAAARLRGILDAVAAAVPDRKPLLVKIAPDLDAAALGEVVEACVAGGAAGLIVSNTTVARPAGLRSAAARESGGLSGRPLFRASTVMLARAALLAGGRLTLIGVGGIGSGADALRKIEAGATLVQLYTAFAYEGPALLARLKAELLAALRTRGYASLREAVGADAAAIAGGDLCGI
jgi:dihydroorotate dehydrogenase